MAKAVRLRVNTSAPFPTQVVGGDSINVSRQNGIYTINSNYSALAQVPTVPNPTQRTIKIYDNASKVYNTMPVSAFISAGAGPMNTKFQNGVNTTSTANSSNPIATWTMGGNKYTFTPLRGGSVLLMLQQSVQNLGPNSVDIALFYGTGTPPNHGDLSTGTFQSLLSLSPVSNIEIMLANMFTLIPGLSIGTTYWFDVAFGCHATGVTTNLWNSSAIMIELA